MQAEVVERATERLESAKSELAQLGFQKKSLTEQIKQLEEMKDRTETEQKRKQLEDYITTSRANLEEMGPREQELQAKLIELEADFQTERAKWDRLQDELDRLENALENSTLQARDRR